MNRLASRKSFDNKDFRLLYIPIETKAREYQAKLLLSCYAAEAGFEVIIGEQVELLRRVKYMPRGIYIEQGTASTKIKTVKLLREIGTRVVAWCEEGLVILGREAYARSRVSPEVISLVDIIFAWGEIQARALETKIPDVMEKTVLTGNPRFDLLRHPFKSVFLSQAEKIQKEYGPFLLVNTNFGIYNNFYGEDFVISKLYQGRGRIVNEEHRRFLNGWLEHIKKIFFHFVGMVKRISRDFPERTIIVRPHPSEDHEAWRRETRGLSNVHVVHEGSAIPWVLASDLLIHNSCTTGVEAFVLGKPVISYRPVVSDIYEPELPRSVSICSFSEEQLVETLKKIFDDAGKGVKSPGNDTGVRELLGTYLSNSEGSFACEKIVAALDELAGKFNNMDDSKSLSLPKKIYWRFRDYESRLRLKINGIIKGSVSDSVYRQQKFPGLTLDEINKEIVLIQKSSGHFPSVKVKKLDGAKTCFRIFSRDMH